MPKCSDCGFLAVWLRLEYKFLEASDHLRQFGYLEGRSSSNEVFEATCIVRVHNLVNEYWKHWETASLKPVLPGKVVKMVIAAERNRSSFTPRLQGFSPKEHHEMQVENELRRQQRRHQFYTIAIATFAAASSTIGLVFGALMNFKAAELGATATRESSRLQVEALERQIQAQRELTRQQIDARKALAPPAPAMTKRGTKPALPGNE